MVAVAMKYIALNFAKLDKFKEVDFRRWQKKMHFLLSSMSVVYVLTTPIPEDGSDDTTVEQIRKRMLNLPKNYEIPWRPNIWLRMHQLGSHLRIEESLRVHDNDKPKSNSVAGPFVVNMMEHNNSTSKTGHIKRDYKGVNVGNKPNGSGTKGSVDDSSNSLKGQNMFNKSLQLEV
ncbi:hypothetical protein Tco_1122807 [Tanacetum coccineum]|uniref:Zinc finger, CCHC-type n=1 Tax=Tanacetum coccineum TaxID=301880 RepID=A0ABQ5J4D5_9ASTR